MTIEHGQFIADYANGGCVFSAGNVSATDVVVRHCGAYAKFNALGGGIYAEGNVSLDYSAVYSNGLNGASSAGGGVASGKALQDGSFVGGNVRGYRTVFRDNIAGTGGGIWALDGATLVYSTIANNRARHSYGGLTILGVNGTPTLIAYSTISGNNALYSDGAFTLSNATVVNSTVSGNSSPFISVGEVRVDVTIANSTIAFNNSTTPFNCIGAIVVFDQVHIESSILADNTCNGAPSWDISNNGGAAIATIIGANNLIQSAAVNALPADTITGVDALLGPLADNGGRTLTHLPGAGSPAIDRGNNFLDLVIDQRGPGYVRVKDPRADIGAIER